MAESSSGPYTQRNVFYLRTSPYIVLQTILYLDHRHVAWFNKSPHILQGVLSALKPRLMPKLRREADSQGAIYNMSKKERVDVYTDPEFRLAFFFRKMDDRHAVLLKEKSLVFPSDPTLSAVKIEDEHGRIHEPIPEQGSRRQQAEDVGAIQIKDSPGGSDEDDIVESAPPTTTGNRAKSPITVPDSQLDNVQALLEEDEGPPVQSGLFREAPSSDEEQSIAPQQRRRSLRNRQPRKRARVNEPEIKDDPDAEEDGASADSDYDGTGDAIPVTAEDEEKMKPKLSVKYAGFRIFGKLLVLVVEPTKRVIAANPELFGERRTEEVRQLSVMPSAAMPPPSSSGRRSSTPAQTPIESSRNAQSAPRGHTPLFRGFTPAESPAPMPPPASVRAPTQPLDIRSETPVPVPDPDQEADGSDDEEDDVAEGFEMASQMLERDAYSVGGGNDIEDGD